MLKFKHFVFGLVLSVVSLQQVVAEELNIYSHRQPFLIQPFLDAFTQKTGIKTNVLYSSKGLAQRLRAEGKNSPADVVLTVDIGRLYIYRDLNLLAEVKSDKLLENVPSHMRAIDNTWFALSKRSRIIVTAKDRVGPDEIKNIEDLADPKWKGRICSRPGSHVYNRALMASVIAHHGAEKAEEWAVGLVNNFARRPQGNDRAQVKAIYEGVCDVGIINNYYFGKLKFSEDENQRAWTKAMNLTFPNQGTNERGAHVNISGGGVALHSKNKANAVALLEFLSDRASQQLFGEINFEYPVNPRVNPTAELQSWGQFKEDELPIERIAELSRQAQMMIDRVGW
ncbi:MAG: Fe(3+) ABC transporter substrate-binding protein [Paracoccaceae bacterium]|nr:Fe(3+) ABC transporter substrate-binding protein [Paracoccaceae bacterium]